MLKVSRTKKSKVALYLQEFPNESFKNDGQVLHRKSFKRWMSMDQRGQVIRHINTFLKTEKFLIDFINVH